MLLIPAVTGHASHTWLFFLPSICFGAVAGYAALADHLREDLFRWWWAPTVLKPAVPGFLYAIGLRH